MYFGDRPCDSEDCVPWCCEAAMYNEEAILEIKASNVIPKRPAVVHITA